MNHDAIDRGITDVKERTVPESWKDAQEEELGTTDRGKKRSLDFVNNIQRAINGRKEISCRYPHSKICGRYDSVGYICL